MRLVSTLSALALVVTINAALADPVGKYDVEGTNPGNGQSYSGTVTVTQTGQTYQVIWQIAGAKYVGTGIGNKDFIAVSYKAGSDNTGLALYGPQGDDWIGVWTYAGGKQMGTEHWTRQ
jgi:hypothetical protein